MSETLSFCDQMPNAYPARSATSVVKRRHAWRDAFDPIGMRRFLIGLYPSKTADNVAADTGMTVRNVQRWLSDEPVAPNIGSFLRLVCAYGAPFLAASLTRTPAWLDDHARIARLSLLEREIARAEAERAALLRQGLADAE